MVNRPMARSVHIDTLCFDTTDVNSDLTWDILHICYVDLTEQEHQY